MPYNNWNSININDENGEKRLLLRKAPADQNSPINSTATNSKLKIITNELVKYLLFIGQLGSALFLIDAFRVTAGKVNRNEALEAEKLWRIATSSLVMGSTVFSLVVSYTRLLLSKSAQKNIEQTWTWKQVIKAKAYLTTKFFGNASASSHKINFENDLKTIINAQTANINEIETQNYQLLEQKTQLINLLQSMIAPTNNDMSTTIEPTTQINPTTATNSLIKELARYGFGFSIFATGIIINSTISIIQTNLYTRNSVNIINTLFTWNNLALSSAALLIFKLKFILTNKAFNNLSESFIWQKIKGCYQDYFPKEQPVTDENDWITQFQKQQTLKPELEKLQAILKTEVKKINDLIEILKPITNLADTKSENEINNNPLTPSSENKIPYCTVKNELWNISNFLCKIGTAITADNFWSIIVTQLALGQAVDLEKDGELLISKENIENAFMSYCGFLLKLYIMEKSFDIFSKTWAWKKISNLKNYFYNFKASKPNLTIIAQETMTIMNTTQELTNQLATWNHALIILERHLQQFEKNNIIDRPLDLEEINSINQKLKDWRKVTQPHFS